MKKPIKFIARYRVVDPSAFLHSLEATEDVVHLSRSQRGKKYTLRGVPAKHVDVVVTDDVHEPKDPRDALVLEHSEKTGRYDGAVRHRLTLRRQLSHQVSYLPLTGVWVNFESDRAVVRFTDVAQEVTYPRLRETLDGYNPARIVMWHWRRYYKHLKDEDGVRAIADAFDPPDGCTLAEANRMASRLLYHLSRELGWRKLTLRERQKYGHSDASIWQRVEDVEKWTKPQCVSDYSLHVASGADIA